LQADLRQGLPGAGPGRPRRLETSIPVRGVAASGLVRSVLGSLANAVLSSFQKVRGMQKATSTGLRLRSMFRRFQSAMIALVLVAWATTAATADSAMVPKQQGWVTDNARLLPVAPRTRLAETLSHYEDETHHQISILIMPSLAGEDIEAFAARVAKAWHVGRAGVEDSVLVVLAMQEKKVRIEVGKDMQRYLSDATAKSIVDDFMTPAFAKRDFAGGLEEGAKWLMQEGRRFKVSARSVMR
jgi:hypothetical protein